MKARKVDDERLAAFSTEIDALLRRAVFRQQVIAGTVTPRVVKVRAYHVRAFDVAAHVRYLPPITRSKNRRTP